jgi:2-keto-3-deoxy-L-fuconate dehydrogenase
MRAGPAIHQPLTDVPHAGQRGRTMYAPDWLDPAAVTRSIGDSGETQRRSTDSQGSGMSKRVQGKVAFCTAAGAGIGRATAIALAREGAKVIATDLNEALLAGLKEEGVAEIAKLDARDTAAVQAMAKRVGPVDVLFNAAGFVHHGTVLDCKEQDWDFSFDLNVKSMHRTIQAFLPGMLAKGKGSIINIASTVGANKTAPNRYVYSATKAAVVGLSRSVAMDFIGKGIRCNCICPGTIETPSLGDRIKALGKQVGGEDKARKMFIDRQPMGRLGRAEEMAYVAVYLASDESDYMTGSCIQPDGGFTL